MFECEECGGSGYISYVRLYEGMRTNDPRACKCLNDFLNKSTPKEIIQYIKTRISGSNAKNIKVIDAEYPEQCPF